MVPSVTLHMSAQAYSGVAENRTRPKASSILGHGNGRECISDVTQQNHNINCFVITICINIKGTACIINWSSAHEQCPFTFCSENNGYS